MRIYTAKCDSDNGVQKMPNNSKISDLDPVAFGWEKIQEYFVDHSGFGSDNEPALTREQFVGKVKKGYGYAITDVGQFQLYVTEYKRIPRPKGKRIKRVFANHRDVCRAWARNEQDNGHACNISFKDGVVYSYHWWAMARVLPNKIALVRDERYSVSTGKHQGYVWGALCGQGYKTYSVADVNNNFDTNLAHYENKLDDYLEKIDHATKFKTFWIEQWQSLYDEYSDYIKAFEQ